MSKKSVFENMGTGFCSLDILYGSRNSEEIKDLKYVQTF